MFFRRKCRWVRSWVWTGRKRWPQLNRMTAFLFPPTTLSTSSIRLGPREHRRYWCYEAVISGRGRKQFMELHKSLHASTTGALFGMQPVSGSSAFSHSETAQTQSKHYCCEISKMEHLNSVSWSSRRRNCLQQFEIEKLQRFSNSIVLSLTNSWYEMSTCWLVLELNSAVTASFFLCEPIWLSQILLEGDYHTKPHN